jgi:hypothetical protein
LNLQHLAVLVTTSVLVPFMVFWAGSNGILILWRLVAALHIQKGKADGRAIALLVTSGILAAGLIAISVYVVIELVSK